MGFSNRAALQRKLRAIPIEVRRAAKAQMKANADQLVETQKRFADSVFADPTGALQGTIRHQDTSTSTRISRRIFAGGPSAPYASYVEFGTKGGSAHPATQPKPYFWAAYRLLKRRMISRMTRSAKKAIMSVAAK